MKIAEFKSGTIPALIFGYLFSRQQRDVDVGSWSTSPKPPLRNSSFLTSSNLLLFVRHPAMHNTSERRRRTIQTRITPERASSGASRTG
jgi:hypothetical protein